MCLPENFTARLSYDISEIGPEVDRTKSVLRRANNLFLAALNNDDYRVMQFASRLLAFTLDGNNPERFLESNPSFNNLNLSSYLESGFSIKSEMINRSPALPIVKKQVPEAKPTIPTRKVSDKKFVQHHNLNEMDKPLSLEEITKSENLDPEVVKVVLEYCPGLEKILTSPRKLIDRNNLLTYFEFTKQGRADNKIAMSAVLWNSPQSNLLNEFLASSAGYSKDEVQRIHSGGKGKRFGFTKHLTVGFLYYAIQKELGEIDTKNLKRGGVRSVRFKLITTDNSPLGQPVENNENLESPVVNSTVGVKEQLDEVGVGLNPIEKVVADTAIEPPQSLQEQNMNKDTKKEPERPREIDLSSYDFGNFYRQYEQQLTEIKNNSLLPEKIEMAKKLLFGKYVCIQKLFSGSRFIWNGGRTSVKNLTVLLRDADEKRLTLEEQRKFVDVMVQPILRYMFGIREIENGLNSTEVVQSLQMLELLFKSEKLNPQKLHLTQEELNNYGFTSR